MYAYKRVKIRRKTLNHMNDIENKQAVSRYEHGARLAYLQPADCETSR